MSEDFLRVKSVNWNFDDKLSTFFSSRMVNAQKKNIQNVTSNAKNINSQKISKL